MKFEVTDDTTVEELQSFIDKSRGEYFSIIHDTERIFFDTMMLMLRDKDIPETVRDKYAQLVSNKLDVV